MSFDPDRLRRIIGGDALANLRARLRRWLESGGGDERVLRLEAHERRALEGLMGLRPGRGRSMRLRLPDIDAALARAQIAANLAAALTTLDGPLVDRAATRDRLARQWTAVFDRPHAPILRTWLEDSRARGLVKRLARQQPEQAARLLEQTEMILRNLPAAALPLGRLAAERLGNAHALDVGQPVATLTLAALRAADASADFERARDAWASVGVLLNELSNPALILNLSATANTPTGALAAAAAAAGEPLHLSLRLLVAHRPQWCVGGRTVYVCENPTVVAEAAARLGAASAPLICTDGMPSASQRRLLLQLREGGAVLRYHGDFDWPGLRIGNLMMRRFEAWPWRFGCTDFRAAPISELALRGRPVAACWDAGLASAMRERSTAVHEEAVIGRLLDDLAA